MPVHVIVPVIIPIAKTITHICNWIIRINYQRLGSLSFFLFIIIHLRATGSSGSTVGFFGPKPSSSSSDSSSSSSEGTGDSAILYWGKLHNHYFPFFWVLARLTSSISYWWFVNGGKSVKCIRKLADEDILLSPCHKMGGFNKVCIFVLFPLREK